MGFHHKDWLSSRKGPTPWYPQGAPLHFGVSNPRFVVKLPMGYVTNTHVYSHAMLYQCTMLLSDRQIFAPPRFYPKSRVGKPGSSKGPAPLHPLPLHFELPSSRFVVESPTGQGPSAQRIAPTSAFEGSVVASKERPQGQGECAPPLEKGWSFLQTSFCWTPLGEKSQLQLPRVLLEKL